MVPRPENSVETPLSEFAPKWELLTDVANMLKAFIGLNFMYISYTFANAGMIRGIIGLLIIAFLTEHCCGLLISVKHSLPTQILDDDQEEAHPPTYGDVTRLIAGTTAERVINAALMLTQFGYCVAYLIFLSQTIHDLVHSTNSIWPYTLIPIPLLSALALFTSVRSLGPFSALANLAILTSCAAVVVFLAQHFRYQPSHPPLSSFPMFFGQVTAALEGIGLVLPVEASMRDPMRFPLVLRISLGTLTMVLMIVAVMGFATFGEDTRSILLLNFGHAPVVTFVKAAAVVGILLTYPLQLVPVLHFCEGFLEKGEEQGLFVKDVRRVILRLGIVLGTAVVAVLAGSSFGVWQALVGSLGASSLAYTAPALLYNKAFWEELSWGGRLKNIGIVVFGICGTVIGTAVSIMEIVEIHRGNSKPV